MRKFWISICMIFMLIVSPLSVYAQEKTDEKKVENTVADVIEKVNQSVVAIIGKNKVYRERDYIFSKMPKNLQHGSGVMISKEGEIITNNHVVEDMEKIFVVTYDGKVYEAKLLYNDKEIDLALIQINRTDLASISLPEDNKVRVGDEVVAIGTPLDFGYRNSASQGIISGLNRPMDESYTYLQTDASINPGNSGGPLVNMKGELVGINSRGYLLYSGVNFAIPAENVSYFLDHYRRFGKLRRCYTGIEFEENWAAMLGIPTRQGIRVVTLKKDAIVTNEQVKEGDILESINEKPTTSLAQYHEILKDLLPGDSVMMVFSRGNETIKISKTLKERPENQEK